LRTFADANTPSGGSLNLIEANLNGVRGLLSPETAQFFLPVPRDVGSNPEFVAEAATSLLSLLDVGAAEEVYLLFQDEKDARRRMEQQPKSPVGICVMAGDVIRRLTP
jgi:hypothetical protein